MLESSKIICRACFLPTYKNISCAKSFQTEKETYLDNKMNDSRRGRTEKRQNKKCISEECTLSSLLQFDSIHMLYSLGNLSLSRILPLSPFLGTGSVLQNFHLPQTVCLLRLDRFRSSVRWMSGIFALYICTVQSIATKFLRKKWPKIWLKPKFSNFSIDCSLNSTQQVNVGGEKGKPCFPKQALIFTANTAPPFNNAQQVNVSGSKANPAYTKS